MLLHALLEKIDKIRKLPENKRKIIFFIIMGIATVLMAGLAVVTTKERLQNMGRSVKNISLPLPQGRDLPQQTEDINPSNTN